MKVYESLGVYLNYQPNGSACLIVLVGKENEIKLTHNGLFNLGATNGELEFTNQSKTMATCWTSDRKMSRFWYNRHFLKFNCDRQAKAHSKRKMKETHESTIQFLTFHQQFDPVTYGIGKIEKEESED